MGLERYNIITYKRARVWMCVNTPPVGSINVIYETPEAPSVEKYLLGRKILTVNHRGQCTHIHERINTRLVHMYS